MRPFEATITITITITISRADAVVVAVLPVVRVTGSSAVLIEKAYALVDPSEEEN